MNKERLTQHFEQWQKSKYNRLQSFYGRYSDKKLSAWCGCKNLYRGFNGFNEMRITGGNSSFFTVAFQCDYGEYNFCVVTAFSIYLCQIICGKCEKVERL